MLTGAVQTRDEAPDHMRQHFPRFQPGAFETNLKLVHALQEFANQKGVTLSQLALGWLKTLGKRPGMPDIIPIPGTCKLHL